MFKRRYTDVDREYHSILNVVNILSNSSVEDEERYSKKARFNNVPEESIEDKLDELIVKIGEKSTSSINKNIEDLAEIFNFDLLPEKTRIVDVFCECVVEFPQKICIYSTLIGLLNVRNYSFGGNVVEKLITSLRNHLKNGEYEKARIVVRFFSDLVNTRVISTASLINLFENLVDVTMEDNIPQVRSDYFVYMVLSALPWVGKELYEKKEQELDQILNMIDSYMNKRDKNDYHSALKVWHSDNPHPQEEYLSCLWNQITRLQSNKWVENHIYRPYIHFDSTLCEALQHNLVSIKPPPHESTNFYPYPEIVFRLFDYTDCPEKSILPSNHSIDRYLIEDNLRSIFNSTCFDRKDCATALLNYTNLSIATKIPLEYIIVEVIFGEMFRLPLSKYPAIAYGSIFLDLCKLMPSTFPQVLAQTVELLFDRLDTMNGACIDRFASWFAYHLSNFQFRWGWDEWTISLKNDPLHPKCKFISETFHYCLRLSYHAKIIESVPEAFHKLCPKLPKLVDKYPNAEDKDDQLDFTMTNETTKTIKDNVESVRDILGQKCSVEDCLELLKDITDESDESDSNKLRIEIFVNVLLNVSSKSMTHAFAYIAKYRDVLKQLNTDEEAQLQMMNTMLEVCSSHQQLLIILIEKLMKSEVLKYHNVASWVFSKSNSDEFMKFFMWQILHSSINRAIKNIKYCTKELEEAKKKLNETNEDVSMSIDDEKNQEMIESIEKLEEKLDSYQNEQKNYS
ncbi:Nuclear cap-binding protein subunit 1 [Sarcoptes scabiei]|uniref:Nuclear cap-binding protein subunit 1 n=1 Tax=Sarcoptes scabiei TaxID=52283 RepID=A0A834RD05_SARSC|nr:Nuclear cap-binding protein subunit 1 [Sarcoptes scabiei]